MTRGTAPTRELVGVVPAAGRARRIAPLPCSKELFPLGFGTGNCGSPRPKVAGQYLLERMRLAGAKSGYIILREGKWDIPSYFLDGSCVDMNLAYLTTAGTLGAPFTVDQAYGFVRGQTVLFGFPDIIFRPREGFIPLLRRLEETGAEVVLGLFPAHAPHKMDMVETDRTGRISKIVIKPRATDLAWTWIMAVWTPNFTEYLHRVVCSSGYREKFHPADSEGKEAFVGDVFQKALGNGMHIDSVLFPEGEYLDIGTPGDLIRAVQSETRRTKEL